VISPDWLEEMAGHLLQPGVGAVGAKLYYPDGRVQHAGVVVGAGGPAIHLHLGLDRAAPGYCARAAIAHELSAVTGACLLTRKRLYHELGGLERRLRIGFNDIDYCLRLQEAGWRVVFTPHAELYHHESATRGDDRPLPQRLRARREVSYMRRRWGGRLRDDPYYSPNLSHRRADFSLGETPRVRKPWLARK
jgi:GT2 family glycosyltransferase